MSPRSTSPGSAACCRRAATFTASPVARDPPARSSPTTTSPVFTPTRIAMLEAELARRDLVERRERAVISPAARTARSASSSWSTGTPNTATTASPMNFSTVPPWRSITVAHRVEPAAHDRPQRLGVEAFAEARRPGHVGEHDVTTLRISRIGLGGGERAAARHAEPCRVRVLRPASCAGGHEPESRGGRSMSSGDGGARPAVLLTGAGKQVGIAAGIAARLADDGWDLALSYSRAYDASRPDPGSASRTGAHRRGPSGPRCPRGPHRRRPRRSRRPGPADRRRGRRVRAAPGPRHVACRCPSIPGSSTRRSRPSTGTWP